MEQNCIWIKIWQVAVWIMFASYLNVHMFVQNLYFWYTCVCVQETRFRYVHAPRLNGGMLFRVHFPCKI